MFVHLPQAEATIDQLMLEGRYNDALAHIVVEVHNSHKQPNLAHHYLYYPGLDRLIERMAQTVASTDTAQATPGQNTLVVVTELLQVGGHSRVVADVVREVVSPTIVLTDLFWRYRNTPDNLNWVLDTYADASIIVLPQLTPWAKCAALYQLTQRLAPRSILYFQHHQDPIAFVGTLGHQGSRKTLIHHCDHNPSLGNTLAGMHHADFTEEAARTCARQLERETQLLPLYVPDGGLKAFAAAPANAFSVVTSGTSNKFAREGELALEAIVHTVLTQTEGRFYFIGPLEADWVAQVQAYLAQQGLDPARFVPLGVVPSVWNTLLALDAHLYLGSAPVGGGRAAIEAQGCGYPLAFFRVNDPASVLTVDSVYADKRLGWSNLGELAALLKVVGPNLPSLSAASRALYVERFSRTEFVRVLREITAEPPDSEAESFSAVPERRVTTRRI